MRSILLLHGALGSGEDLQPLCKYLSPFEFHIHVLTFSGHGGSAFMPDFGISQFSEELEAYINKNRLEKPAIFGYSMGGYVALNLAVSRPDMIGEIICLGTKFEWSADFVKKESGMLNADLLAAKNPDYANLLSIKHGASWKELLSKTSEMMYQLSEQDLLNSEKLASLKTRILLGIGDRDKMVTLNETVKVFQSLPNGAMFVLPKSKHPLELVDRKLLGEIIMNFILHDR